MRSFWNLRAKLLALALAALAPAILLGTADSAAYLTSLRQQAFGQVEITAVLAAQQVREFVRTTESLLTSLGEVDTIRTGTPEDRDDTLAAIASGYTRYNALFFLSPNGMEQGISTHQDGEPRLEAGHRAYVQEALQSGTFTISREPVQAQSTGVSVVPMVAPVRAANGQLIGLVGGGVRLTRLQEVWEQLPLPPGSRVSLVDRSELLGVARSRDGGTFAGRPLPADLAEDVAQDASRPAERRDENGTAWLVATQSVEGTPWAVIVEVPSDVALATWHASLLRTAGLLVLAVLAALALALALASRLTRPVHALSQGAEAIASGDLAHRIRERGSDEIAAVAHQFNLMAAELQDRRATLERRVADATQAERERSQQLADEKATVERLRDIGATLSAELDLRRLLQTVTDLTTVASGAQVGAFFQNVLDDRGESYMLYAISGISCEAFEHVPMPRNTAVFAPTFRGEGVVRSDDITQDPRYGHNPPYHGRPEGHPPVRSYLAVPVKSRTGDVLGGLFFGHEQAGVFSEREERLVAGVAGHAAIAIDNARLYEAAQHARTEAEAAVRARDEFMGIAAHELKTPLAVLLGSLDLLDRRFSRGPVDATAWERGFHRARQAGTRLRSLVEDLLDISRLQSGQLAVRKEPVAVNSVIGDAAEVVQAQWPRLRIALELPDPSPVAESDPARLHQVLVNLLDNAMKYSPQGGEVRVTVHVDDGRLRIEVSDRGIGFPPEAANQIFEPFGRASNASERQIQGMGLGLYLSRNIVEAHGGRLWAESPGEGQGATFHVDLPMVADSPVPA